MPLDTFIVIFLNVTKNKQLARSFNRLSELLPAFTCARAIHNL